VNQATVPHAADYPDVRRRFHWNVPKSFNLGVACCDVHPPSDPAIIEFDPDGDHRVFSFGQLRQASDRLANGLEGLGLGVGDRVAILVSQSFDAAVAHLAIYKGSYVAVPLSQLFGTDALRHRLVDSGARAMIVDEQVVEVVDELAREVDATLIVVGSGGTASPHVALSELLAASSDVWSVHESSSEDPALIIYTSGTTAAPKGALHAHRVLYGHLPGFELSHDYFPQPGDVFWTPADWAWIGGLMDALMPSLFFGRPVVASPRGRFDPELVVRIIGELGVRSAFLPPTALRLMRQAGVDLSGAALRSVMSGGEPLDPATLDWFRDETGLTIAEIYGQTEANYLVGNSPGLYAVRPGSMGRPYPGHEVATIDESGERMAAGELGEIAVLTPDPVAFLGYWRQPEATAAKYAGQWLRTGDLATVDSDGYFWFKGRTDDLISVAGYRVSPVEVEACLLQHPTVGACAVVGVPDALRGQVIKAFVVPARGSTPSLDELREHVRDRLAAYEMPREIELVSELPLTVTGKVRRRDLRQRRADSGSDNATNERQQPAKVVDDAPGR
jgi:acetyl-CoA synthetase